MTSLRILGPVEAWNGEQRLALGGPLQLKLFAFLVLHANRAVSRDLLTDAVWRSEWRDPQNDNRLTQSVSRLREALKPLSTNGEPLLRTVTVGYLLTVAPGELDADVFHAGVHAGIQSLEHGSPDEAIRLLSEAEALWRGPVLAEVTHEDFAQGEIRRLEGLRDQAVLSRMEANLQLGRHREVIAELNGLLAQDPKQEQFGRLLMLALYRSGRQADALEVYRGVVRALLDIGLEPGRALQDLQLEILDQTAPLGPQDDQQARGTGPPLQVPMPTRLRPYGPALFVGRQQERRDLDQAFSDLQSSGRQVVFVTGEPGIGKTRLVSEFAHVAHDAGALVLAGRCDEGLRRPYQPFVEALEHLVAHAPAEMLDRHVERHGDSITRLVPALGAGSRGASPTPTESERYVLFESIDGLFAAAAKGGPLVLVLEDVHWGDPPTVQLLGWLVNKPRNWSLMLVSTCRISGTDKEHPLRKLLADLHREPDVLRLDLIGLGSDDIAELIGGMQETPVGAADLDLARTLESNTNGNPFFVTELVRDLTEKGALVTEAGELRLKEDFDATANLPVSISETLEQRLHRMDDDVRHCLGVASAVGDEFDEDLVSEIAGAGPVSSAMARAVDDGALFQNPDRPGRFRFAHALMRRYLYGQLDSAKQTDLHRRIALAIERRQGQAEGQIAELARHWAETVDANLDTALRYSTLAGDDALEKLAPDDARRWYQSSLDLLARRQDVPESRRCELLIKRGQAERQAGDRQFRATLLDAAGLAQRIGDDAKLVRAALGNTRGMQSETGVVDEARIAVLDSAIEIVGTADSPERARLLAMRAAELMYSREWERRVQLSDEALAIARRLGDADALSTVLNMRFVTLLAPGTLDERRQNTVDAVAAAAHQRDRLTEFYAYHWRGYACVEAGDIAGARSWFEREQALAEQFRQPTTIWLRLTDEANLAIIRGDLELADQLSRRALGVGSGSEPDAEVCFAAQQTSIAFDAGHLGALVPDLEQAVNETPGVPGFRATLALALVQASRFDEARRLLEPAVATNFHDVPYDVTWLAVACIYAQVCCELGNVSGARMLYGMLEPWSTQIAFPAFGVWGPVSVYLGSLALALGDRVSARQHLNQAARAAIQAGARNWEARANAKLDEVDGSGP